MTSQSVMFTKRFSSKGQVALKGKIHSIGRLPLVAVCFLLVAWGQAVGLQAETIEAGLRAAPPCPGGWCLPPGGEQTPPQPGNIRYQAVARVIVTAGVSRSFGTGTLVYQQEDRSWLLTCAHLFEQGGQAVTVIFPAGVSCNGRLAGLDRQWDLALVELPPVGVKAVPIAEVAPQAGDWLTACGYGPDGQYRCVRGQLRGYVRTGASAGWETLSVNGAARQGDSGGPVFNEAGQLVGVIWGSDGRMIVATYCGRIRQFLDRLLGKWRDNLPADPPPPQPAPTPEALPNPPAGAGVEAVDELRRQILALDKRLGQVEEELGLAPAKGSQSSTPLSSRLARLEELTSALPALRQKVAEAEHALGGENLRAVIRDVALGLLAEQAPSALERWLPRLVEAIGWTTPPSLAVVLAARFLGRVISRRAAAARAKYRKRSANPAAAESPPAGA